MFSPAGRSVLEEIVFKILFFLKMMATLGKKPIAAVTGRVDSLKK